MPIVDVILAVDRGLCKGRLLGYGLSSSVWCLLAGDAVGASRLVEFGWSPCRLAGGGGLFRPEA